MNYAIPLHVIAVVIWVGGMLFAHMILRPVAAGQLPPPQRLPLWVGVFARFFPLVWICVITLLVSGLWMIFSVYGGMGGLAWHVHTMFGLGLLMMLIFFYVFFVPYRKLKKAVAEQDWPTGARALSTIRHLVGVNTLIGFITIVVATGGMYWFSAV